MATTKNFIVKGNVYKKQHEATRKAWTDSFNGSNAQMPRKKRVISGISSGMEDTMYLSDDNSYCGIK